MNVWLRSKERVICVGSSYERVGSSPLFPVAVGRFRSLLLSSHPPRSSPQLDPRSVMAALLLPQVPLVVLGWRRMVSVIRLCLPLGQTLSVVLCVGGLLSTCVPL